MNGLGWKRNPRMWLLATAAMLVIALLVYTVSQSVYQRRQVQALSTQLAVLASPSATRKPGGPPVGCVFVDELHVRAGPGAAYPTVGQLYAGDCVSLEGRTADGVWLRAAGGWVTAASLQVSSDLEVLPLIEVIGTPYASQSPLVSTGQDGCPQGCPYHKAGCDIKGNISVNTGEKIYHVPGDEYYDDTVINPSKGERWFCTEEEAVANGWRRTSR